jgi:hypothetical protein
VRPEAPRRKGALVVARTTTESRAATRARGDRRGEWIDGTSTSASAIPAPASARRGEMSTNGASRPARNTRDILEQSSLASNLLAGCAAYDNPVERCGRAAQCRVLRISAAPRPAAKCTGNDISGRNRRDRSRCAGAGVWRVAVVAAWTQARGHLRRVQGHGPCRGRRPREELGQGRDRHDDAQDRARDAPEPSQVEGLLRRRDLLHGDVRLDLRERGAATRARTRRSPATSRCMA